MCVLFSILIVLGVCVGIGIVGVGVVIIINPPNSSSGRCNDNAAIDTITVFVVVAANFVVNFDQRITNNGTGY